MPVFISYSHKDKKFVDTLAAHLVKNKTNVWVDRWELNVGDSIIQKVQDALQNSSALLVVLSKSSTQSEWCKQELNSGLNKQLNEKKVFVLPVLLEDCDIPLFLQDKMYADFRENFDDGLSAVLDAIAKFTSANVKGRIEKGDQFFTDWSHDWGEINNRTFFRLTFVDHSVNLPFSILSVATIIFNESGTSRYNQYRNAGVEWFGNMLFLTTIAESMADSDCRVILEDQFPQKINIKTKGKNDNVNFDIEIESRWLGEDTGKDILVHLGNYFEIVLNIMKEQTRKPTEEEKIIISKIVETKIVP